MTENNEIPLIWHVTLLLFSCLPEFSMMTYVHVPSSLLSLVWMQLPVIGVILSVICL